MSTSLTHRTCPRCHTPVGWQRFLFKSTIWARWPCPSCGTMLKFSWKRRLLLGIGFGVLSIALVVPTFLLTEGLGLPVTPMLIVLYLVVSVPLLLLDGVELA